MTASNFAACDAFTAQYEGGFTDNPGDAGNWTGGVVGSGTLKGTNFGISAAAYPNLDIKGLTAPQASTIRQTDYWTPCQCDALATGLDVMIYDMAVNSGNWRSIVLLQQGLGVTQDGVLGPISLGAAAKMEVHDLIAAVANDQMAFYQRLAAANANDAQFLNGWLNRVQARMTLALEMADGIAGG